MKVLGLPSNLVHQKRTLVMGVINVTSDSFSDGGDNLDIEVAIASGLRMIQDGADIIDIGGESTRPGAERTSYEEETARVLPVIRALSDSAAIISVDTMRARVAAEAVEAGAHIVNDVSGGLADPAMAEFISAARIPYVVMHWRGHSDEMSQHATYKKVTKEVRKELSQRIEDLVRRGVDFEQIILDPGLGFAKEPEHNWTLLHEIEELEKLERPLLVGHSRKRFLGELLNDRPAKAREYATVAVTSLLAERKIWGVRVHDVRSNRDAIETVSRWRQG
jgi:dihydropteroate synthase